jgi:hypothetical protein
MLVVEDAELQIKGPSEADEHQIP